MNVLRTYFREMRLPEAEKKKRIELAEELEEIFLLFFWTVNSGIQIEEIESPEFYYDFIYRRYMDAIDAFPYFVLFRDGETTIESRVREIVDTTFEELGIPYILSEERARLIAETETNYVGNSAQFNEAQVKEFTKKKWLTMKDERVRHNHFLADEQVVLLDEPFKVGNSLMMYPLDQSLGAPASEVINCRCTCEYMR